MTITEPEPSTINSSGPQLKLVSPEAAPLLVPKLTDDHLATLRSYGTSEPTVIGQVLFAAGDPTYDLMVVLEGEVEVFDIHQGCPRPIATLRPRDFIAELNLLTGQRVYVTAVVSQAGSILRIPRQAVMALIGADGALADLLVQTMFRRRQAFSLIGSGIQIVGSRSSPDAQRLREFAARNRLAHNWIDLDRDPAATLWLRTLGVEPGQTPAVLLGGSALLANPTNAQLAAAAGITEDPQGGSVYDLVVVGAGPAGLAAAVYGATEGLTTAVVDRIAAGGQAATTSRIENYLGFPTGISGEEFGERAHLQAQRFGAEMFIPRRAVALSHPDGHYAVTLDDGMQLFGKSVILATGVSYRRLDVPGIERFENLGVFYSPLDPARDVEPGETVVIIGGGNSAGQAAVALAAHGHPVVMAVRGRSLASSMSTYLLDRISHMPQISVHPTTLVTEVVGDGQLRSVILQNLESQEVTTIDTPYLLAMIGAQPHTEWLGDTIARDDHGFILTGDAVPRSLLTDETWCALGRLPYLFETNLPGVFAVGDVRANSVKRVAAAAGEGSMAMRLVQEFIGRVPA
jgi:thioredoxin reductase (NADPH)